MNKSVAVVLQLVGVTMLLAAVTAPRIGPAVRAIGAALGVLTFLLGAGLMFLLGGGASSRQARKQAEIQWPKPGREEGDE